MPPAVTKTESEGTVPHVDRNQSKFSQACTVLLAILAYLFQWPVVVAIAAICLALNAFAHQMSPYSLLYKGVVIPLGLLKPKIVEDDPNPHRFASAIGMVFLVASTLLLFFTPFTALGWVLDLIIFVLSGINLTVGFCLGCFMYYHLGRWGLLPRVRYEGGFRWRGV
jgi:predicted lysophospholipase L1 biosynthesis ABC-type transport system permease subunit